MNPNKNPFVDFDQLLDQIEEVHISEETPFGECDACEAIYETYSREPKTLPYLTTLKAGLPIE